MMKFSYLKTVCAAMAMFAAQQAFADPFTYNGYTFDFIPEEENNVKLTDVDTSVAGDVVIPGEIPFDGKTYTLTQIETYSFNMREDITSVTVPNTVTSIAKSCFVNMPNLSKATLSENLVEMGDFVFQNSQKLESIVIPDKVTTVGPYVLSMCPALKNVTIGKSVKRLGESVFWFDAALEVINLPASVETIGTDFASGCTSLTAINVDPDNATFASSDGVLYDKNFTILYSVPGKKESVTMPNTVKTINESAFLESKAIKTVTLSTALEP